MYFDQNFSDVKFAAGYEKDMRFLVIMMLPKAKVAKSFKKVYKLE